MEDTFVFMSQRRTFLVSIKVKLGIRTWYGFRRRNLVSFGGLKLLKRFAHSPVKPQHYWKSSLNQKKFMDSLENSLQIEHWTDWYGVTKKQIVDNGGISLIDRFNGSPSKLITTILPQHSWDMNEFKSKHQNYWKNPSNQREFMESLKLSLKIRHWTDWYSVSCQQIIDNGGGSLLKDYFNGSPSKLITSTLPQHPWKMNEFKFKHQNYWKDPSHAIDFLDLLKVPLRIRLWTDWYSVTAEDIIKGGEHSLIAIILTLMKGGRSLLNKRNNSPSLLIMSTYPYHPWNQFEFRSIIKWDKQLILEFLGLVKNRHRILTPHAWRTFSTTQLMQIKGGKSLLSHSGSLQAALK